MSATDGHQSAIARRSVTDVVCTACGCLCDDIELEVNGDRIIEARNACPLGSAYFLDHRQDSGPGCLVDGSPATLAEGVERAARLLAEARSPLIFGLGATTSEAQRVAVSLADRIGASVDVGGADDHAASTRALQDVGEVTCSLGEIKNRADLVIVWGADPIETHPRLFSRYALEPAGLFRPGGRRDRYCVVVDVLETRTAREAADQFIQIREGGEIEALWTLRALAAGISLDPTTIESATGMALKTWRDLMDRMKRAHYGVLFYGASPTNPRTGREIAGAVHSLTREMNALTRFVCMPLASAAANTAGARNVLAWRTGYPGAVNLARGYPRYAPGESGAADVLARGEADAVLIVSGDPVSSLDETIRARLSTIPTILLNSKAGLPGRNPAVVFRTAAFGIGAPGTVYRLDGVPLPLRTVLPSPWPTDEEVLRSMDRRVRSLLESTPGPSEEDKRCR